MRRLAALAILAMVGAAALGPASAAPIGPTPVAPGMNGLIAYADLVERGNGALESDIFTVTPEGKDKQTVTDALLWQFMPAWSPDGGHLLYVSNGNLVRRDRAGGLRVLAWRSLESGDVWAWTPEYSPDGSRIVYCLKQRDEEAPDYDQASIVVASADGTNPRVIVDLPGISCDHAPSWSPDGKWIAFDRPVEGTEELRDRNHIYVVRSDGTGLLNITPTDTLGSSAPVWVQDGRIMFQSWRDCPARPVSCGDIYTMAADGSDVRRVTFAEEHPDVEYLEAEPSPDERYTLVSYVTAFQPPAPQDHGILVLDAEGDEVRRLVSTRQTSMDWQPSCTVRGTRGNDVLHGTAGRDLICGLGGDDVIKGLGGNDSIFGHAGIDRILGGAGRDILVGNGGRDRCDRDPADYSRVC